MLILFKIVQGFQKYIWLVYQTSPGMGIILLKLTRGPLRSHIGALELNFVNPSSPLKNNSHSGRRLKDKQDIFLESLDNFEQN